MRDRLEPRAARTGVGTLALVPGRGVSGEMSRPALYRNFPQAFSQLALVEAAGRVSLAERVEELSG